MLKAIDQYAAKAGRMVVENRLAVASVVSGATVALCPDLVITPVLRPLGFTPDGIVAGSLAAAAQSRLGDVAAGGMFAFCQSAAAGGYGATSLSSTASAAVVAVAKAVVAMNQFGRDDEYARSEYGSEEMSSERAESPTYSPPPQAREVRGQWGPGGHSPVYVEEAKTCWLCRLKWGPECEDLPTTNWACERCEAPLCLNEERNCYREYHAH